MLFPDLRHAQYGYVNLNTAAEKWFLRENISQTEINPLLDPVVCEELIQRIHQERGLDFSYGGWLEDRRALWRGSYLDAQKLFIHLGVDFNVPAGTRVAADTDAEVIRIDSDVPEEGGWGTRIILKPVQGSEVLIYAHLDPNVACSVGDYLKIGDVFANVGRAPQNGGWFPHLHVQCVDAGHFEKLLIQDLKDLDGYGNENNLFQLSRNFRDPLRYVSLR